MDSTNALRCDFGKGTSGVFGGVSEYVCPLSGTLAVVVFGEDSFLRGADQLIAEVA